MTLFLYRCLLCPGLALTYILENSFKPESGSRPGVPKIGILITDGKSQDDVIPPAQSLKDAGIELFAIGTTTLTMLMQTKGTRRNEHNQSGKHFQKNIFPDLILTQNKQF